MYFYGAKDARNIVQFKQWVIITYKNKGRMIVPYNYYLLYVIVSDHHVMQNDAYISVNYTSKEF